MAGLFGYLQFGVNVSGNVLTNYQPSTLILVVIALFVFVIIVAYPLTNFPVRLSLDYLFFSKAYHDKTVTKNNQRHRLWLYTILLYIPAATMGAYVEDISTIFSLTGATSTVLLSLMLPPIIYLKLRKDGFVKPERSEWETSFLTVFSWIVVILAGIIGISGLVVEILDLVGVAT